MLGFIFELNLKKILFYGILGFLLLVLLIRLFMQHFLKRIFKKYNFSFRIAGLLHLQNIFVNLKLINNVFTKAVIQIQDLRIAKIPGRWNFIFKINGFNIKLDMHSINLQYEKNFNGSDNNNIFMQTNLEQDNIVSNALKILQTVKLFMQNIENQANKTSSNIPSDKNGKKSNKLTNTDESSGFVQIFLIRALSIIIMRAFQVEISNVKLEIMKNQQEDTKTIIPQNNAACLMRIQLNNTQVKFEYLKTDQFLMSIAFREFSSFIRNKKDDSIEFVCGIPELLVEMFMPVTLKFENSFLKATIETHLNDIEFYIKEEQLDTFMEILGNLSLTSTIVSFCKRNFKAKLNQNGNIEKIDIESKAETHIPLIRNDHSKSKAKIREGLVPLLPQHIKISITSIKLSLPIRSTKEILEHTFLEDIVAFYSSKMSLNISFNKLENLKCPSRFDISTHFKVEALSIKTNTSEKTIASLRKIIFDHNITLQKNHENDMHSKTIKAKLKFDECLVDLNYTALFLIKRLETIITILDVYRLKIYEPFLTNALQNNNIYQMNVNSSIKENEVIDSLSDISNVDKDQKVVIQDVELILNEVILNGHKVIVAISDFQKSFTANLLGEEFEFKLIDDLKNHIISINFRHAQFESNREFHFGLMEANQLYVNIVEPKTISKETTKSMIEIQSLHARLNDFVVLKLISIYKNYTTLGKKLGLFAPSVAKIARERQSVILNTQKELTLLKLKKNLIIQANLQIQLTTLVLQYDYLDTKALKLVINSVEKHQQKLSSPLDLMTINTIKFIFLKLNEINPVESEIEYKFLSICSVKVIKEYESDISFNVLKDAQELELNNSNIQILMNDPLIEIQNDFHSIGLYISDLADSISFMLKQLFINDKDIEKKDANDVSNNFNIIKDDLLFSIRNFKLVLEDSFMNASMMRFQHFIRSYASKGANYDELEILKQLRQSSNSPSQLLYFEIGHMSLNFTKFEKTKLTKILMLNAIQSLDPADIQVKENYFSSIKGAKMNFHVTDVRLGMRDYPVRLFCLKSLNVTTSFIDTTLSAALFKPNFGSLKKYYYKVELTINELVLAYGLSYSSGTNELIAWISKFNKILAKKLRKKNNSEDGLAYVSRAQKINSIKPMSYWDKIRYRFHGTVVTKVPKKFKVHLLTHIFPYSSESLKGTVENLYIIYKNDLRLSCDSCLFKRNPRPKDESHFLKIPQVEALIKLDWICNGDPFNHYIEVIDSLNMKILNPMEDFIAKDLKISFFLNIPKSEIIETELNKEKDKLKFIRNMVKQSNVTFFHFQVDLINGLINLPQLRYDMLKLYKINIEEINNTNEEESAKRTDHYSDYMELIKHTLNSQLNKDEDHNNIIKLISEVHLKIHISSTRIIYSNIKKPYVPNIENLPEVQKSEDPLKILSSIVGAQSVIDFMTFNCTFYQKQARINTAFIKSRKQKQKKKKKEEYAKFKNIWRMKDGYGKLNFMYGAAFDGLTLISLKPKEFEYIRLQNFELSINNPSVFLEFFEQIPNLHRTRSMYGDINKIDHIINHLFEMDNPLSANAKTKYLKTMFSKSNVSMEEEENQQLCDMDPIPLGLSAEKHISKPKDFNYTSLGIFFKADMLVYEQDKRLLIDDDEFETNELSLIENFFTFSGCKLLISFDLKTMLKNLINSQSRTKKMIKLNKVNNASFQKASKNPEKKLKIVKDAKKDIFSQKIDVKEESFLKEFYNKNLFIQNPNEVKKSIKFVVVVEQPQFNLQYLAKESQMLLASRKHCMIIIYESCLPYDKFRQDLKFTYKTCFKNLECFVAPTNIDLKNKNNAFWLDPEVLEHNYSEVKEGEPEFPLREGLLLRIISCDRAFFNYNNFDLEECEIDFSKPLDLKNVAVHYNNDDNANLNNASNPGFKLNDDHQNLKNRIIQQNQTYMWKNEPRINSLIIKVDKLISYMDSYGFKVFRCIMVDFILLLLSSSRAKLQELELKKQMLNELKHIGRKNLSAYIQSKLAENDAVTTRKKSKLEYSIEKCSFTLTKDEIPFIKLSIEDLFGSTTVYSDDSHDFDFQIKSIDIANLVEQSSEYRMILTKLVGDGSTNTINKGVMFSLKNHSYFLPGIANVNHKWRIYELFEIKGSNVVVKLTEDIYQRIYEYFFQDFGPRSDQIADSNDKEKNREKLLQIEKIKKAIKPSNDSSSKKAYSDDEKDTKQTKNPKLNEKGQNIGSKIGEKDDAELNSTDDPEIKALPSFYKFMRIGELKADFSFKSSSFLKRFSSVKISMSPFTKYSRFWTSKKLFDTLVRHLIKQGLSQIFSIFGQKLGLSKKEIQINDDEAYNKDVEKKRKMLLGL